MTHSLEKHSYIGKARGDRVENEEIGNTMWMNKSWGGRSFNLSLWSSLSSRSTARSHKVSWSSAPDAAKTVLSHGCHSIDVIGAVWCLKVATGIPLQENHNMNTQSTIAKTQTNPITKSTLLVASSYTYFWNCLRSQILMIPSSPPDIMNGSFLHKT